MSQIQAIPQLALRNEIKHKVAQMDLYHMTKFKGFSIPEFGIIPPEFYDVLPKIEHVTELKVTITALRLALQFGMTDVPYSLKDFALATGLGKSSILRGIKLGVQRGTLKRIPFGRSFVYRVNFRDGSHGETPCMHDIHTSHATTSHTSTSVSRKNTLAADICKLGVATRVALDLVKKHDAADLKRHIAYAQHAEQAKLARNTAAWFVASVRDNWGPPLGFGQKRKQTIGDIVRQLKSEGKIK